MTRHHPKGATLATIIPRVREAFCSPAAQELFVPAELLRLVDEHCSGKVSRMQQIWSFYSFIVWYDQFLGPAAQRRCV